MDEKTRFEDIKIRLWNLLAYQITRFRYELNTISKLNDHGRIAPDLFSSFVPSLLMSGFFFFRRYSFPFGRPEGALKATLSLFERVT